MGFPASSGSSMSRRVGASSPVTKSPPFSPARPAQYSTVTMMPQSCAYPALMLRYAEDIFLHKAALSNANGEPAQFPEKQLSNLAVGRRSCLRPSAGWAAGQLHHRSRGQRETAGRGSGLSPVSACGAWLSNRAPGAFMPKTMDHFDLLVAGTIEKATMSWIM